MVELLFLFSLFFLLYIHLLYPALIIIVGFIKNIGNKKIELRQEAYSIQLPLVSLIIAAYNEESVIERKLQNCLDLDYPEDLLEIIVFSDGSTDKTDSIVNRYADLGVKLLRYEGRIGKTACQNRVVRFTNGSIIVYSDATSLLGQNCLKSIVEKFNDTKVGSVVGKLASSKKTSTTGSVVEETFYLSFLQWLKRIENSATMPVGGSGALFAVRSKLTVDLPEDANDDLLRPVYVVLKGYKIVYDEKAVAMEDFNQRHREIFLKKTRIAQRAVHSIFLYRELLNPFRYGLFSLQFVTKVILRRLIFPLLVIYMISGTAIFLETKQVCILMLIAPFYILLLLAVFGAIRLNKRNQHWLQGRIDRLGFFCYYYLVAITGAFIGLLKGLSGQRVIKWN